MTSQDPPNIRAFNFMTLAILNKLYDAFPERVELSGMQLVVEWAVQNGSGTEESKYLSLLPDTMAWLKEEGFLRWGSATLKGDYQQVTLTLKALTVLGYLPSAVAEGQVRETLIDRTKRVLARGAEGGANDVIRSIVASAFTLGAGMVS